MAWLSEMRTGLAVLAIRVRLWVGLLALPSGVKPLYRAKGLGLIALRWHGLAHGGGLPADAARRIAARAAEGADRALAAMVEAELCSGALFDGLRSFAAHPERYPAVTGGADARAAA